jgi:hypothetical protein
MSLSDKSGPATMPQTKAIRKVAFDLAAQLTTQEATMRNQAKRNMAALASEVGINKAVADLGPDGDELKTIIGA